jgi:hypothetical protein
MVTHASYPSTLQEEAGVWQVPGQPELHSGTLSQNVLKYFN